MPRFPIEYEVNLVQGATAPFEIDAASRPSIAVGAPPDFGGSDAWWSPEHLFVSATASCFAATFFALAKAAQVGFADFRCHGKGVLERASGTIAFSAVHLTVRMRVEADRVHRVRELVEEAKQRCFVANSLRCLVTVTADIQPS